MKNIASERTRLGLSQKGLADKIGVSRGTVARWEGGVLKPSAEAIVKLANLFGCSADYILELSEERRPCR